MTEEQKKEFIEWFDKLVDATKQIIALKSVDIKGFDGHIASCWCEDYLQINKEAFKCAIECFEPTITERIIHYRNSSEINIERTFVYKDLEIISLFKVEV